MDATGKMTQVNQDLEKQDYFHGFRPRKDLQHLLTEPDDFLVRVTDGGGGPVEIIVSVLNDKKEQLHLTLCHEAGLWQFTLVAQLRKDQKEKQKSKGSEGGNTKRLPAGFATVCDLIKYYKDHKTPGKAFLKRAILRPKWLITHDQVDYKQTDVLGSGHFCHVYKGKYKRTEADVYEVAVKVCHEGKLATETNEESREARKAMISEAQTMANYVHESIVTFHGVALAHPPILIVMEFCAGGNLENHLTKCGDKIGTGERLIYALEAARGLRYLHAQGCIHRDIAARNCLISSKGIIKISDFGLSMVTKDLETKTAEPDTNPEIPVRWMAPESLQKPINYNLKSDIWSYGALLFEIFNNGVAPFPDIPKKKAATHIRHMEMPPIPEKAPKEVRELMTSAIWVLEPTDRPSAGKVCRKLYDIVQKTQNLPPADLKDWLVNSISGVKRTEDGMKPLIGDVDTRSNDGQTIVGEPTGRKSPSAQKK